MVPGSDGLEPDLMKCCQDASKNGGLWFPGLNDCATILADCIKKYTRGSIDALAGQFRGPATLSSVLRQVEPVQLVGHAGQKRSTRGDAVEAPRPEAHRSLRAGNVD